MAAAAALELQDSQLLATHTDAQPFLMFTVNGGWSSWTWGACSKSCGGGVKYASRTCTSPAPQNGGNSCAGASRQSASCNTHGCPVNGGWSSWAWGACSKSCGGGVKYASRTCTNPSPKNGGSGCAGSSSTSTSCNTHGCPVNGGWSSWTWGACSKSCGGGVKFASRTCTNPSPKNGGSGCAGSSSYSTSCNTHGCPAGPAVEALKHDIDRATTQVPRMEEHHAQVQVPRAPAVTLMSVQGKQTSFSDDGGGNLVYLDRHGADCGNSGFINDIRVERNSAHNKVRYNYYCCNLPSTWASRSTCYTSYTGFTDDGGGRVYYLDRQTVSCNSGYALSYIRLQRNSSHNKVSQDHKPGPHQSDE
eukprot:gene1080-biopygen9833